MKNTDLIVPTRKERREEMQTIKIDILYFSISIKYKGFSPAQVVLHGCAQKFYYQKMTHRYCLGLNIILVSVS